MRHTVVITCLLSTWPAFGQTTPPAPSEATPGPKVSYRQHQNLMVVRNKAGDADIDLSKDDADVEEGKCRGGARM